jgi:hypothetical protein
MADYRYHEIGRKRGEYLTCAALHADCDGCEVIADHREDGVFVLRWSPDCPVHKDAPE